MKGILAAAKSRHDVPWDTAIPASTAKGHQHLRRTTSQYQGLCLRAVCQNRCAEVLCKLHTVVGRVIADDCWLLHPEVDHCVLCTRKVGIQATRIEAAHVLVNSVSFH